MSVTETPAKFEASSASAAVEVATTRSIPLAKVATRSEHDLLGEADIPSEAYWGVHTLAGRRELSRSPAFPSGIFRISSEPSLWSSKRRPAPTGGSAICRPKKPMPSTAPATASRRRVCSTTVRGRCDPGRRWHLDQHECQ